MSTTTLRDRRAREALQAARIATERDKRAETTGEGEMTQGHYPRHSMSMYASKDDMLTAVMKENEELHAQLVAEAARTAEQKLRADQISKQHDMQCAMHKEAVERAMRAESELEAVGAGGVESLRKSGRLYQIVEPVQAAAAQQAVQAAVPLPLLVRDIARDLGITVPQACIALKPLGNYSTNSAVTAEMARMLRDHFPAPAHPAEGVPAQAAKLPPLPDPTAFLVCKGSEVTARAWNVDQMRAYAAAALAATQPAAQGMEQDAARYQALVESGNFAPSPFDNGMWGLRASSAPSTKAELDAAVDRVIAAQAKQGGADHG